MIILCSPRFRFFYNDIIIWLFFNCVNNIILFSRVESSYEDVVVAFPKLEKLEFDTCSKWEDITGEDITEEEEEEYGAMSIVPCLTHLYITGCENLKKLHV